MRNVNKHRQRRIRGWLSCRNWRRTVLLRRMMDFLCGSEMFKGMRRKDWKGKKAGRRRRKGAGVKGRGNGKRSENEKRTECGGGEEGWEGSEGGKGSDR